MPSSTKSVAAQTAGVVAASALLFAAPRAFVAGPSAGPARGAAQERLAHAEEATPAAQPGAVASHAASSASGFAAAAAAATVLCAGALATRRRGARASLRQLVLPLKAFESELGVQAPVGFWDPLGFAADGDVANFKRRRGIELKHGRIAMLATMGYITPEITGKFPGYLSTSAGLKFADVPNGLAAISKVPALGWLQIVVYGGYCELSQGTPSTPGDYGWKVLTSSDPAEKTKKLSAEIANGRLAMAAIIGMFFQDGLTGSAWGDWALYTASPLRAV